MASEIKVYGLWDTEGITIRDMGLADYITIKPMIAPRSDGRHTKYQYHKSKMHIVERLANKLFVAGHKGKKHKFSSGRNVGQTLLANDIVLRAFKDIEAKTKKNPIEVLVRAIENAAPLEEVITYQQGGIMAREGVVSAPQRRVDIALRHMVQGTYLRSRRTKKKAWLCLSEELTAASKNDAVASFAVSERVRKEKEAIAAR